jgi:hypothetical protein
VLAEAMLSLVEDHSQIAPPRLTFEALRERWKQGEAAV